MKIKSIRFKIILYSILFSLIISSVSLTSIYYWSFTYFKDIFEDKIIKERTLKIKESLGIKNEWILGVTTNSIEVVQSIHGDEIASVIENKAQNQHVSEQSYHENILGKDLFYNIKLNTKDGEIIYEYSIIRDVYSELFPKICIYFIILTIILILISIFYINLISNKFYKDITLLRSYTKKITQKDKNIDLNINTKDHELESLVNDLKIMKNTLEKEENIRQATLQYISHEMKTPLMIIEGYTTSAKDNLFPKGDLNSTLDTVLVQTNRIKQKVNDLITIIKLESTENFKANPSKFNCIEFTKEILSLLSVQTISKKININIPKDLCIFTDKEQLKIVFENLITNQIKYSEKFFSISSYINDKSISFYFFNDGKSISDNIKPHIFKPFVKEHYGGSGLGLSICKAILNNLNGKIYFEETSYGCLFIVELPYIIS